MTFISFILVFIGISVFLIFRKDWKKCVYFLIFMLPSVTITPGVLLRTPSVELSVKAVFSIFLSEVSFPE